MKTNIVETGVVIEKAGGTARVLLGKGQSCRKCGLAKLGLCRPGGANMIFTVEDRPDVRVGDTVMLGLKRDVHRKGYVLGFILPLVGFVMSAIPGYLISSATGISNLEVLTGFIGLSLSLLYSLKKLNKLDKTERMHIKRILSDDRRVDVNYPNQEGEEYLRHFERAS